MRPRQHLPSRWMFTDERLGKVLKLASRLPPHTGIVVRHHALAPAARRRLLRDLRRIAAQRRLQILDERDGWVARVHDSRELRRALLSRTELIFLSSLHPTRSHPGRPALPRMRAAALARLAGRRAYALGGMDTKRFAHVQALGFAGWGGVDAFVRESGLSRNK